MKRKMLDKLAKFYIVLDIVISLLAIVSEVAIALLWSNGIIANGETQVSMLVVAGCFVVEAITIITSYLYTRKVERNNE